MRRRDFLPALAAPLALAGLEAGFEMDLQAAPSPMARKGRIKQGITRDVFTKEMSLEDCCKEAAGLGVQGFDLIGPADWPLLRKYKLTPSMYPSGAGGTIPDALNNTANHSRIEVSMRAAINEAAAAKVPNVITFSGNRKGMDDRQGADNCVAFLNNIKAQAEDKGVTICMEFLNSKVSHKDYMFDRMAWGVDVMQRVNSPNVKILYDIYHAQVMEGNITQTIRENIQYIGHFHTSGTSGRESDDSQELNYGFIMRTIAGLGFEGFVSHEYSPMGRDAVALLSEAVERFDV